MNNIKVNSLLILLVCLTVFACTEKKEEPTAKPEPVSFRHGDECHVCGMIISNFPGPKGQVIVEKSHHVLKFCSTRDMFSWLLQPENINRDHTLYVHDMARSDWENPNDTALINAREAFYVVGSGRKGAMGPTLAAFAVRSEAAAFAGKHGGKVVAFSEITMDHLTRGLVESEAQ
ncbi:MAG: nitrous oxide reductase accessory protein NosL [Ketobacteraceae bacterium]|nr:nitrous oxide reductase accessory protein NosL [Ketobacteraceae bacterium]